MYWQQAVSLSIVAATAALLLWTVFRRRKFSLARGAHCGCISTGQSGRSSSMVYRARKGERKQVVIKMK